MADVSIFNVLGQNISIKDRISNKIYNTVAEMIANKDNITCCITLNYIPGDGIVNFYVLSDEPKSYSIALNNGKYAIPIFNDIITDLSLNISGDDDLTPLFDTARDYNINHIVFYNTHTFNKSYTLDKDYIIEGGIINQGKANMPLFITTHNLTIKNIKFVGGSGIENEEEHSLIESRNTEYLQIDGCSFSNIKQVNTTPSGVLAERCGVCYTAINVKDVKITNNNFDTIVGDECGIVVCSKNRTDYNIYHTKNKYTNLQTSALTFLGNNCFSANNYYNFIYSGSCINLFGLQNYVENEEIEGQYNAIFDFTEGGAFMSNIDQVKNIVLTATANHLIRSKSLKIVVDNVQSQDNKVNRIIGYVNFTSGDTAEFSPFIETAYNYQTDISVINCDFTGGHNSLVQLDSSFNTGTANIHVDNCTYKVMSNSIRGIIESSNAMRLNLSNCYLIPGVTQQSGLPIIGSFPVATVTMVNCIIAALVDDTQAYLFINNTGNTLVSNCIKLGKSIKANTANITLSNCVNIIQYS